jgi:hypothetical protein
VTTSRGWRRRGVADSAALTSDAACPGTSGLQLPSDTGETAGQRHIRARDGIARHTRNLPRKRVDLGPYQPGIHSAMVTEWSRFPNEPVGRWVHPHPLPRPTATAQVRGAPTGLLLTGSHNRTRSSPPLLASSGRPATSTGTSALTLPNAASHEPWISSDCGLKLAATVVGDTELRRASRSQPGTPNRMQRRPRTLRPSVMLFRLPWTRHGARDRFRPPAGRAYHGG